MITDNALDALTARMLEAVKNTRESADSAAASAQKAQKMAEGEMQGTSLTGAEKKLLVQILQRAANKNSEMQPAVDELKKLWKESLLMIERNISLASTGSARTSGCDNQLRLGYSRNRGIYRLNITQTGEWEGMTIRALWHTERGMLFSSLVEDGKIEVPAIVTSTPGCGRLVFEGSDGTRTLTSADIKYNVAMNSGTMGDIPEPPVPAWQQLVALVEQAKDEAWQAGEDARQSAAKANEAYENTIGAKDSAVTEIRKAETDALNNVEASAGPAASAAADAAAAGARKKPKRPSRR